jgi:hypothetical protein
MQRLLESFCLPLLSLALLTLSACDSTSDDSLATFSVSLEGSGSGVIETQSIVLGLDIECRLTDGEVSGVCQDDFAVPEDDGFVRVRATLNPAMSLNWGSPCQLADGAVCDVSYEGGTPADIEVRASFDVKTDRVLMDPPNAVITIPGDEGAVVISARAIDEDGDDVAGITYTFQVDRTDVVSMTPQSANSVRISGIADGQALITATAQGVAGITHVDVRLSN